MLPFRFDRWRPVSASLATILAEPPCQHATITTSRTISWAARRRMRGLQLKNQEASTNPRTIPTTARPVRTKEQQELDDQVKVNFYDQENEGPQAKRQRTEDDQYMEELAPDVENFNEGLAALEKDIEAFELPKDATEDPATGFFSKAEREAGTAAMIQNLREFGGFPHRIQLPPDAPTASRVFVEKFNQCLDEASLDPGNEKARKDLWRFYERSKIYIPGFLKLLPDSAWELLWTSQTEDSETNPSRASHLRTLGEDMIKAGRKLDEDQRFGRLEGLFLDGQQEKALQEWEKAREAGDAGNPEFLEMGIRMHTYAGKLARAEELLDALFKLHNTWDPRIMAPVIAASINSGTEEGAERGWTVYQRMRDRLGNDMTMDDFDAVTMHFLRHKRTNYALAVFRDMMLVGEARETTSASIMQKVSARFASLLKSSDDKDEVSEISLQTIQYLPRRYQNRFFYAKWLKKLIGMGELDSAAQVIELMYERGTPPDAKHLNGLVGAWLRNDSAEHRKRAEELAWAMVQKRLDRVRDRKILQHPDSTILEIDVTDNDEVVLPSFKERRTPDATVETFCVLLEYYVRKGNHAYVRHLRNLLPRAELNMNSVVMNQLLYNILSHSTETDARHIHRNVWRLFDVLTQGGASPDIETWICLWECMKTDLVRASELKIYTTNKTGFPTPRQLFQRMAAWSLKLRGQQRKQALDDIENDTYNDIIRCFLMARDLEGAFVAMNFLTRKLDVWPSGKTARMLLLQISQINTDRARRHRRVLKPGKADMDDKMARTTAVMELVTQHRRESLQQQTGKTFEEWDELGQAEESLRTLLQFLYTLIRRAKGSSEASDEGIQVAAKDVVGEIDVQDCLKLWKGS